MNFNETGTTESIMNFIYVSRTNFNSGDPFFLGVKLQNINEATTAEKVLMSRIHE